MNQRVLIVNADDLGYDPEVSRGILQAMEAGAVSSATLMVNTPFCVDAANRGRGRPLGLHLNLGRHPPCSAAIPRELLVDGGFFEGHAPRLPAAAVEVEALAQLDRLAELTGRAATHLDVHKHLHRHPNVLDGVLAAASSRRLPVRAIDAAMRAAVRAAGVPTTDHFIGDAGAEAYWTWERYAEALHRLPEGSTELMCHPGFEPRQTRSGYSAQREVELRTFLDPRARPLLDSLGIRLADFTAIAG